MHCRQAEARGERWLRELKAAGDAAGTGAAPRTSDQVSRRPACGSITLSRTATAPSHALSTGRPGRLDFRRARAAGCSSGPWRSSDGRGGGRCCRRRTGRAAAASGTSSRAAPRPHSPSSRRSPSTPPRTGAGRRRAKHLRPGERIARPHLDEQPLLPADEPADRAHPRGQDKVPVMITLRRWRGRIERDHRRGPSISDHSRPDPKHDERIAERIYLEPLPPGAGDVLIEGQRPAVPRGPGSPGRAVVDSVGVARGRERLEGEQPA